MNIVILGQLRLLRLQQCYIETVIAAVRCQPAAGCDAYGHGHYSKPLGTSPALSKPLGASSKPLGTSPAASSKPLGPVYAHVATRCLMSARTPFNCSLVNVQRVVSREHNSEHVTCIFDPRTKLSQMRICHIFWSTTVECALAVPGQPSHARPCRASPAMPGHARPCRASPAMPGHAWPCRAIIAWPCRAIIARPCRAIIARPMPGHEGL